VETLTGPGGRPVLRAPTSLSDAVFLQRSQQPRVRELARPPPFSGRQTSLSVVSNLGYHSRPIEALDETAASPNPSEP